jgi:uncharacterized protein (DUF924 family)
MSHPEEILTFWFGEPQDNQAYYKERQQLWFSANPQFDQEIRDRFTSDYQLAAARKLMDWQQTPRAALALVILLDQFPRNMFRNDPQAFATDPLAGADKRRSATAASRTHVYLFAIHAQREPS